MQMDGQGRVKWKSWEYVEWRRLGELTTERLSGQPVVWLQPCSSPIEISASPAVAPFCAK